LRPPSGGPARNAPHLCSGRLPRRAPLAQATIVRGAVLQPNLANPLSLPFRSNASTCLFLAIKSPDFCPTPIQNFRHIRQNNLGIFHCGKCREVPLLCLTPLFHRSCHDAFVPTQIIRASLPSQRHRNSRLQAQQESEHGAGRPRGLRVFPCTQPFGPGVNIRTSNRRPFFHRPGPRI